ncbi:hypothetical protein V2J09_021132 [Rumex salicifolius]
MASLNGYFDCVQLLIDFQANVSAVTFQYGTSMDLVGVGSTPLHYAACGGNLKCCQILIAKGASRLSLNCNGWLPVDVAKMWGRHWLEPLLSFIELHIVWNMTMEEQKIAAHLANTMSNSLKGRPALGRIFQGKEPPQFVALFEPMIVLKGGLSSGSKLAVKALGVEPYTIDGVALIQISGISTHNSRVVRVDTPGVALKHAKEGTENSTFWAALGGKQNYASKKESQNITRDPHLYSFSINRGMFQVEEIYNFIQDDLLTEDTLILNTHVEVFVWVGHTVDPKEKQKAFEMGEVCMSYWSFFFLILDRAIDIIF